jgi:hypothetical protein
MNLPGHRFGASALLWSRDQPDNFQSLKRAKFRTILLGHDSTVASEFENHG